MVRRCWVNFQCRGILLVLIIVGQGPTALTIGAGGGCLDIFFSHLSFLSSFSFSLGDGPGRDHASPKFSGDVTSPSRRFRAMF